MNHTPGPWQVEHHNSGASRVDAGLFEILLTSRVGATAEVWTANANLIAAAPELLAALKAVLAVLKKEAPGTPLNNRQYDQLGIDAHNAIAKAEGR